MADDAAAAADDDGLVRRHNPRRIASAKEASPRIKALAAAAAKFPEDPTPEQKERLDKEFRRINAKFELEELEDTQLAAKNADRERRLIRDRAAAESERARLELFGLELLKTRKYPDDAYPQAEARFDAYGVPLPPRAVAISSPHQFSEADLAFLNSEQLAALSQLDTSDLHEQNYVLVSRRPAPVALSAVDPSASPVTPDDEYDENGTLIPREEPLPARKKRKHAPAAAAAAAAAVDSPSEPDSATATPPRIVSPNLRPIEAPRPLLNRKGEPTLLARLIEEEKQKEKEAEDEALANRVTGVTAGIASSRTRNIDSRRAKFTDLSRQVVAAAAKLKAHDANAKSLSDSTDSDGSAPQPEAYHQKLIAKYLPLFRHLYRKHRYDAISTDQTARLVHLLQRLAYAKKAKPFPGHSTGVGGRLRVIPETRESFFELTDLLNKEYNCESELYDPTDRYGKTFKDEETLSRSTSANDSGDDAPAASSSAAAASSSTGAFKIRATKSAARRVVPIAGRDIDSLIADPAVSTLDLGEEIYARKLQVYGDQLIGTAHPPFTNGNKAALRTECRTLAYALRKELPPGQEAGFAGSALGGARAPPALGDSEAIAASISARFDCTSSPGWAHPG